jgi:Leucine-rich repeat (LRR) protein
MRIKFLFLSVALVLVGGGCVTPDAVVSDGSSPRPAVGMNKSADFRGQGLTAVPEAVFRDVGLLELDVSDNRIEGALPAEIRRLQTLEVLDASGNKMTGVPAEIGQLRELRILNLADNDLTGLPRELGNLQKLELLDVSGNPYSEIDLEGIRSALPATTVIRQ